jgi:hypothetical protein
MDLSALEAQSRLVSREILRFFVEPEKLFAVFTRTKTTLAHVIFQIHFNIVFPSSPRFAPLKFLH